MTVKNNTNTTYTFRNPTTDETTAMHNAHSTKPKELENPKTEIAFGNSQQIHNNIDFAVKTCKKLYHK